jgi:hypothetical protein
MPAVAIAWTSLATLVLCTARPAPRATERGGDRRIAAITICSPTGTGGVNGDCDGGTFDTQQVVLGPGGSTINDYGFGGATDEHSTVLPPGYLKDNSDYLFVVASGYKPVNRDIGAVVLSSSAPDANGQWVLQPADGYGVYPPDLGAVFLAPVAQGKCPPPNADTGLQDATFDLAYAAPGSVLKDPTSESGRLLMIYEGTNTCIGSPGGKNPGTGAYETIGVAP